MTVHKALGKHTFRMLLFSSRMVCLLATEAGKDIEDVSIDCIRVQNNVRSCRKRIVLSVAASCTVHKVPNITYSSSTPLLEEVRKRQSKKAVIKNIPIALLVKYRVV